MRDIIIYLQESDAWEIQLKVAINFISSKGVEEEFVLHSKSDNIKFRSCYDANDVVYELFESLCLIYQDNLEKSMEGNELILIQFS